MILHVRDKNQPHLSLSFFKKKKTNRRKQSRQESDKREFSVTLNDVQNSPVPGSTGAVYENLNFRAGQEQQQGMINV